MTRRWFEIALGVPANLVDEAAALLDLAGFGGVEIRERGQTADVVVVVQADGDAGKEAAAASAALELLGPGTPVVAELDPKVWTENWKQHFARRTFGDRIEVRPPWEDAPAAGATLLSVIINPGMAFGTGLHETTAGCLELLVDEVRPGMRVADVGCGSGILAIAAARLGASEVLATDVDPLAVEATSENIEANEVSDVVRVELEPGEIGIPEWETDARPGLAAARSAAGHDATVHHTTTNEQTATPNGATGGGFAARAVGSFDLVVANILAETLVEMQGALASAVRSGGTLVLSGIEARRLKIVEEAFIGCGWHLARKVAKGDWVSLSLHHIALAEQEQRPSVAPADADPGTK